MRILIFFIGTLIVLVCSCKSTQELSSVPASTSQLYLIESISKIEDGEKGLSLYVIQTIRNDSTFFILERDYHPKIFYDEDKKIKVGSYYNFNLTPLYSTKEIDDRINSPMFAINYLDYKHPILIQGATFNVDWKYVINSYTTRQLKALYYFP